MEIEKKGVVAVDTMVKSRGGGLCGGRFKNDMHFFLLFFAGDGDGGSLHIPAAVLYTLGVFWTVFDGVRGVSVGAAERAGVGAEHGASHFPVSILEVVGCVETLRFAVVAAEDADLWFLDGGGQLCHSSSTPE